MLRLFRRHPAPARPRTVRTHTTTPAFRAVAAERGFVPDAPPFDQDAQATAVAELAALARPIQRGDTDLEAGLRVAGIPVHDTHPAASSVAGLASLRAGAAAQGTLRVVDDQRLAPVVLLENRRAEVERRGGAR
ncbi:hypothetical protein CWIS_13755 [Cellulomonas sp. A375-1]|uniref:hypothetical protein n=1 Tax=Cellulomonas sp. A375-1 TaxID=1672219 RepID=UPI00065278B4|nr:hypothetical protein [Cellulomonas sp. A375-1]KMM44882.1 hypothetical protein CWIS_13755 [Cellulomonas sp. A375-1]